MLGPEGQPNLRFNLLDQKPEPEFLRDWLAGPVVLASSSEVRRNQLESLGFKKEKISLAPVPDNAEREALEDYQKKFTGNHFAPFRTDDTKMIAAAKVNYVLSHGDVPADALVVAADTVPHYFKDGGPDGYLAEVMHKPKDREDAKRQIKEAFSEIIKQYLVFREAHEGVRKAGAHKPNIDSLAERLKLGWKDIQIEVSTGIAVCLPKEIDIEMFNEEVAVLPERLYKLVEDCLVGVDRHFSEPEIKTTLVEVDLELDKLIDRLLEISGDRVTHVSGGIPWSDSAVREFMQVKIGHDIRFIQPDKVKEEDFTGLPTDVLKSYLRGRAIELKREGKESI